MADFMVLPRPTKSMQNGAGFSRKTGTYWASRKGKSDLSATERAVGKNAGAVLAKRKRNRAVRPEYQIMRAERVKMGESRTLARVRGIRARAWRGKNGLHGERRQIPMRIGRASKESLLRTSRRKHERVSGPKALQDDLQSLNFTPSLAKPEIGKEVGRRRAHS